MTLAPSVAEPRPPEPPAAPHPRRRWWGALLPPVVVAAALGHALWTSWLKWGDPIVDGGREMELPRRVAEGAELYVDVRNLYGPLPTWINAALFRGFGAHLDVLIAAGVVSAAAMSLVLYRLARRFVDAPAATVVVVAFVYVCAFAHLTPNPSFNFVIPYAYAATYGMLLAASSLLFLVRHAQEGRDADLAWSVGFAVLTFGCKLESAAAVSAAHLAHLAGAAWLGRLTIRRIGVYGAGVATVAAFYGALRLRVGPGLWSDNVFSAANAAVAGYARMTMGFDDVGASLSAIALSAAVLAAAVGLAGVAGALARRRAADGWNSVGWPVAVGAGVAAAYALLPVTLPLRVMSALVPAVLSWLAIRWWRARPSRPEILGDIVLWAFVLGALSRQMLRVVPEHYGFVLVPVPLVALAVALFRYLPAWVGTDGPSGGAMRAAAAGVLLGTTFLAFRVSGAEYDLHRDRIDTPQGSLILADGGVQAAIVRALEQFPRGTRAIVVPQGAGLVFLSGLTWNDGTFAYTPTDVIGTYDDAHLVERWSEKPPDVVVYVRQDMSGFGYREFGDDYAQRSARWLAERFAFTPHPAGFLVGVRRR